MAKARLLTMEQAEYLASIQKGLTSGELAERINAKYGLALTAKQVKDYRNRRKLHSGLTGHFPKGNTPHNKGKKYPDMPANSGQFKKGHVPPWRLPVGSVSVTEQGYYRVKVAQPDKWEYLHRQTWEREFGAIPEGNQVVFLDGDRSNWDISNLACLSRKEMASMNHNHWFSSDPDLTKTGIGVTRINNRIRELKAK